MCSSVQFMCQNTGLFLVGVLGGHMWNWIYNKCNPKYNDVIVSNVPPFQLWYH